MSTLTNIEKRKLERILGMSSGYVLDFSNRTFSEFVTDSTGREIYDSRYDSFGGSKANRLRGFWAAEGNHNVGKLLARIPRSGAGALSGRQFRRLEEVADDVRLPTRPSYRSVFAGDVNT